MTPFEIARGYIGTTEGPGPENNPVIMTMYASVGHDWVEHDSVAWCAAFVGHCLERAGMRSTRKLTARSYLDWGIPVNIADAQPGDIGVIPRGTSSWQGHVFFIDRIEGPWVWGLGGNQSDAVNVKRYPVSKLLGVRRAGNVAPAVILSVRDVQTRLRELGYHEVGTVDGMIGPRTRAAILAFRDDHALPLIPIIDVALTGALEYAAPREVAPARAAGSPEQSRIVAAASGTAAAAEIHIRRVKSVSSSLGSSEGSIGSSAMPQSGQAPGSSRTISGCIGQVYWTFSGAAFGRPAARPEA